LASKITGNSGAGGVWRVDISEDFDPAAGYSVQETWIGTKAETIAKRLTFANGGFRTKISNRGPLWQLDVWFANAAPPGQPNEVAVDTWGLERGRVQISIWSHPSASAAAVAYGNPADFRKIIEDAVKDGTTLAATALNLNKPAEWLWRMLSRGAESYETKRPILRKMRTYSTAYTERIALFETEPVYITAALISTFSVPAEVQAQLPDNPTTVPYGCAWGWLEQGGASETIPAIGKIQEARTWVFAAWSVVGIPADYPGLYTLITS